MSSGSGIAANLKLAFIILAFITITIVLVPVQLLAIWLYKPLSLKIPLFWHRCILYVVGAKVTVRGTRPKNRPLLIAANHVSWSDILILGSTMELCFIAKDDVKSWPVINWLANLQRTVYVNRQKRTDTKSQVDTIASRMAEGDAMVLFAEGTTGNGHYVYPFKSALFGAAQIALDEIDLDHVTVQPVAIAYTRLFGMPLGRYHQTLASWPGDIPLGSHLLGFLRKGAYDVEVIFGDPISFTSESKRRDISRQAEKQVREMFAKAMQGHYHREVS